ncbi:MAG: hypothetical protein FWD05_13270 [Oscillospiraceae bacterium]|nr:hypothetical protein [Oscillospiraceae bacterium]
MNHKVTPFVVRCAPAEGVSSPIGSEIWELTFPKTTAYAVILTKGAERWQSIIAV